MLETNQKFRTIIVERRTKAGNGYSILKLFKKILLLKKILTASLECMKDNSAILTLGLLL